MKINPFPFASTRFFFLFFFCVCLQKSYTIQLKLLIFNETHLNFIIFFCTFWFVECITFFTCLVLLRFCVLFLLKNVKWNQKWQRHMQPTIRATFYWIAHLKLRQANKDKDKDKEKEKRKKIQKNTSKKR